LRGEDGSDRLGPSCSLETSNASSFWRVRQPTGEGSLQLFFALNSLRRTAEMLRGVYPEPVRSAFSKITRCRSFPRKRDSSPTWTDLDPRLRGGDNSGDFHLLGLATGPWGTQGKLCERAEHGRTHARPVSLKRYYDQSRPDRCRPPRLRRVAICDITSVVRGGDGGGGFSATG
jgi:hypothetical protein